MQLLDDLKPEKNPIKLWFATKYHEIVTYFLRATNLWNPRQFLYETWQNSRNLARSLSSGARYPQFRFGGSLWVTGPRVKLALKTVKSRDSKLYSVKFVKFGFPKTHFFFTKFIAVFARSHLLLGSLGVVYPMAKAKASVRETAKPAVPRWKCICFWTCLHASWIG